ncbi:MAG: hypothetical protein ACT4P2_05185 [Pseudomonadota bacterium]
MTSTLEARELYGGGELPDAVMDELRARVETYESSEPPGGPHDSRPVLWLAGTLRRMLGCRSM